MSFYKIYSKNNTITRTDIEQVVSRFVIVLLLQIMKNIPLRAFLLSIPLQLGIFALSSCNGQPQKNNFEKKILKNFLENIDLNIFSFWICALESLQTNKYKKRGTVSILL